MLGNIVVGKPTVSVPSINTNVVIPSFGMGQPSWVQLSFSQPLWGNTYPGNQPLIFNQNYKPIVLGVVYPRIPYPISMYTPWGKTNWSNVLVPRGPHVNTTGGYGGPPSRGLPPGGASEGSFVNQPPNQPVMGTSSTPIYQ